MKNKTASPNFVLGEGVGYSIENFILNPLIISAGILHKLGPNNIKTPNYLKGITFSEISGKRINVLQKISDALVTDLLSVLSEGKIKLVNIDLQKLEQKPLALVGGKQIKVSQWFLEGKGHEIEELILFKFPFLKKYGSNGKNIGIELAQVVASSHVSFIPEEFESIFKAISNE